MQLRCGEIKMNAKQRSCLIKEMYNSGISIAVIASKLRLPMMEVCVYLTSSEE